MTPDFFETPAALRRWFKTHHASSTELWVGFYKKDSGGGGVIQSAKKTETRDRRLAVLRDGDRDPRRHEVARPRLG